MEFSLDLPIDPPPPWPCNHVKGEGCEGCDARNTDECPNMEASDG